MIGKDMLAVGRDALQGVNPTADFGGALVIEVVSCLLASMV
jgi:hypothetical protein